MIGGDDASKVNVISNNVIGVAVANTTGARLRNNRIGTNRAGSAPLGNDIGIQISNSLNTECGNDINAYPNVVSGNSAVGIDISNNSANSTIYGNLIGTDLGGVNAVGNGQYGIYVHSGAKNNVIGSGVSIGGSTYPRRNVISGQNASAQSAGVLI